MRENEKSKAKSRAKEMPLANVLDRNIKALVEAKRSSEKELSFHQRMVNRGVNVISSMGFFYFHAIVLGIWFVLVRLHANGVPSLDRVAGIASLEAIFLSTLVLINQRNMGRLVESREDLDLQMNLITEHEITRILHVVDLIAAELKIDTKEKVPDIEEAKKDISPEMVLDRIEALKDEKSNPEKP
jgi:uncharacterized membrane protein